MSNFEVYLIIQVAQRKVDANLTYLAEVGPMQSKGQVRFQLIEAQQCSWRNHTLR